MRAYATETSASSPRVFPTSNFLRENLHKNQIKWMYDWTAESMYSAAIKDVEDYPVM